MRKAGAGLFMGEGVEYWQSGMAGEVRNGVPLRRGYSGKLASSSSREVTAVPVFLSTRAISMQRGRIYSMQARVLSWRSSKLRFSLVSPQKVRAGLAY